MLKNLKKLRLERGLTQTELATIIGRNQQDIVRYENTSTEPDIQTLIALSKFFHTSVDYIIGNTENPSPYLDCTNVIEGKIITPGECHHLIVYRKLNKKTQKVCTDMMESYTK